MTNTSKQSLRPGEIRLDLIPLDWPLTPLGARKDPYVAGWQNKPFDVFTTDGTFIKTFTYQFEAKEFFQKEFHITSNISIRAVLAGRIKSSAGFIFKYK